MFGHVLLVLPQLRRFWMNPLGKHPDKASLSRGLRSASEVQPGARRRRTRRTDYIQLVREQGEQGKVRGLREQEQEPEPDPELECEQEQELGVVGNGSALTVVQFFWVYPLDVETQA